MNYAQKNRPAANGAADSLGSGSSDAHYSMSSTGLQKLVPTPEELLITEATAKFCERPDFKSMSLQEVLRGLMLEIGLAIDAEMLARADDRRIFNTAHPKITKPKALDEFTVATVLLAKREIRAISLAEGRGGSDLTLLGCMTMIRSRSFTAAMSPMSHRWSSWPIS